MSQSNASIVFCLVPALEDDNPFSHNPVTTCDLSFIAPLGPPNSRKAFKAAIPDSCATTLLSVTIFLNNSGFDKNGVKTSLSSFGLFSKSFVIS